MTTRGTSVGMAAIIAMALGLSGCESDRYEPVHQTQVMVEPQHVELSGGESAEFVASGWHEYAWSLDNTAIGTLSRRKGDRTRYTAVAGNTNVVQVLTVTATQRGTNVVAGTTAQAVIVHR